MRFQVTKGMESDIIQIKGIVDVNRRELGFIRRSMLTEQHRHGWLMVAKTGSEVIGFVSYRHRTDGQTTLYEICVKQMYRRKGVGTALIAALCDEARRIGKERIILRCPEDLVAATRFYKRYGFVLKNTEEGKRRPLNVWELLLR